MSKVKELFTEKFRPKDMSRIIIPDRIRKELGPGLTQNLLLGGPPGTGKTSLAYILAQGHATHYINASADGRIAQIERIKEFCGTMSIETHEKALKVVILDEVDGASAEFFDSLRPVIEKYHKTARFIMTCNYMHKIPSPIMSRMNFLNICAINKDEENAMFSEYVKRAAAILNILHIKFTQESVEKFVKGCNWDLRRMMNQLQSFYNRSITELDDVSISNSYTHEELYKICISTNAAAGKAYENYKFITSEYANEVSECLYSLGTEFVDYLYANKANEIKNLDGKIPQILICVADYQNIMAQGPMDPLVTLLACVAKLNIIINN